MSRRWISIGEISEIMGVSPATIRSWGGSIRGPVPSSSTATIRLEARSRTTGARYLLLSCTYAGGGCSAGGSYETLEHVEKGQRL